MAQRDLDAVFYINNVPDVFFTEGLFHIAYDIGKRARFEIVMLPATFLKAGMLARDAQAQWRVGTAASPNVVPHRRKK